MKALIAFSFVPLASLALAEKPTALAFPNSKIEVPPQSLLDGAKQGLPPIFGNAPSHPRALERPITGSRRIVSHMPIVVPARDVDARMLIKLPDESIDFKILVKTPDVDSAK